MIRANAAKVDGVKVSLLDAGKEIALRRLLPSGVRMYTGDDFNFAALIGGDASGHSDALLGIFDAIAPAASAALTALAAGDRARFDAILAPTVPLSRHVFAAPTRFYKTGVVFMAWLNGHQSHFTMVGGQQSARSVVHLAELFRLADAAGLLRDPGLAAARMRTFLARARNRRVERSRPESMTEPDGDLLSLNTATVRAQWKLPDIIAGCARHGIRGISPWRDQVAAAGLKDTAQRIRDAGLVVSGYCRGGMFPAVDRDGRRAALDDNKRAVDEALTVGARCLVLVVGGLPKDRDGRIRSKDLPGARAMVRDGIGELLEYARPAGMPLAIEPLHPMYAADRACVNTLAHANDLCDELGAGLGIAVDAYHVWWDPQLEARDRARRAGIAVAPSRVSHLRLARAHDRPPQRPWHDGRRRDRPAAAARLDGRQRLPRHARGRDLLRQQLVEARSRRGARHLQGAPSRVHVAWRFTRALHGGGTEMFGIGAHGR